MTNPLEPIGIEQVKKWCPDKEPALLLAALASVDQLELIDDIEAEYVVEIWDRKSPINQVSAERMLERPDIPADGEIFLIKSASDGKVLLFQPFEPATGGHKPMTTESVQVFANASRQSVVNDRALIKIKKSIIAAL